MVGVQGICAQGKSQARVPERPCTPVLGVQGGLCAQELMHSGAGRARKLCTWEAEHGGAGHARVLCTRGHTH